MAKNNIEDIEFVRYLECKEPDGKVSSHFTAQPYLTGMYVALYIGGSLQQLTYSHKQYASWVRGSMKMQAKNGMITTTVMAKFSDFHSVEDIKTYIVDELHRLK